MTRPLNYPYRFASQELRQRVQDYATRYGLSINGAINVLLTDALDSADLDRSRD